MERTIPSLNTDVTVEILTRLPAKPLARFRSICKQWHSHASDPRLLDIHSARAANRAPVAGFFLCDEHPHFQHYPLLVDPHAGLPDTSFSFLPGSANHVIICSSCNGLILCTLAYSRRNFVCNPTTMEYLEIPTLDGVCQTTLSLAFDPTKSPYFTVVAICEQVHVYSSEAPTWRRVTLYGPSYWLKGPTHNNPSMYWNGLMIWDKGLDSLLTYDVEQECLGTLPLPLVPLIFPSTHWNCYCLGVSKGSLHMIGGLENVFRETIRFDILEMKPDCGFQWSTLYHVQVNDLRNLFPEIDVVKRGRICPFHLLECWPLCILRGEEAEEDSLLLRIPGRVVAYNLQKRVIKEVCSTVVAGWYRFVPYTHTLVSLRSE